MKVGKVLKLNNYTLKETVWLPLEKGSTARIRGFVALGIDYVYVLLNNDRDEYRERIKYRVRGFNHDAKKL